MKFSNAAFLIACGIMTTASTTNANPEDPIPAPVGACPATVDIELVGSLGFTGNLASPVPIGNALYFIDQTGGAIYRGSTKIFDSNILPPGITWGYSDFNPEYVLNVAPGPDSQTIYVALGSTTLPAGVTVGGNMPAPVIENITTTGVAANIYDCSDTVNEVLGFPDSQVYYQIIYKFRNNGNKLKKPEPIIAFEAQGGGTHKGGAMLTLGDGKILFFTGDGINFGSDGRASAQDEASHLSKILLIDPTAKTSQVVAKGVRNPQHAEFVAGYSTMFAFMDIGGVTAEEVNVVTVADLLDTTTPIENFGWGRNADGFTREGTTYIEPGVVATFGSPPFSALAPSPEEGFHQPFAQFGRNFNGFVGGLNAVTGPVTSIVSLDTLSMLFSELNSGTMFGTFNETDAGAVAVDVCYVTLVDKDNNDAEYSNLNALNNGTRVDPRFFRYPDGTAGVLLEKTGNYYRFTETV